MAFFDDDAMPDIATIQAENERLVAAMHEAENKKEGIQDLSQQLQTEMQMFPIKFGIGGAAVIFAIYWFLIRR